jgi:glycosyltransferase involved in cell wall biosynthesis
MMDYGLEGFLRNCDGVITVGEALGKILHKYNSLVTVIPNYRYSENLDRLPNLRDEFCISNDDKVVLCISHITTSLEEVIHAVSSLSNEVKLVIVGQILPPEYKQKIVSIIDDLGLNKRVFIRDPVPYSELTSYASGADIGLIVRDPAISNNYISFPNRVFDYVFSGLPIVTPYMPDISRFVEVNKCGVSIDGIGRDSWKYGINKALDNRDLFSNGAIKASKKYTWEWLNDNVIKKAFNEFQSIAFVGINDLSKNNRTIRLCRSLVSNSKDVSVLSPLESPESFPSEVRLINTMDLE